MMQDRLNNWEAHLKSTAQAFLYPPTPNVAQAVMQRLALRGQARRRALGRLGWVTLVLAVIGVAITLAVPTVRAAVLEFLQIGAVRILLAPPTATSPPPLLSPSSASLPPIPTSQQTFDDKISLLDLAGETSLDEARTSVDFPIRLPAYPASLGLPDDVYMQDLGAPVVVLVWSSPEDHGKAWLSLHIIPSGSYTLEKVQPRVVQGATVNGLPAVWAEDPNLLRLRNGNTE